MVLEWQRSLYCGNMLSHTIDPWMSLRILSNYGQTLYCKRAMNAEMRIFRDPIQYEYAPLDTFVGTQFNMNMHPWTLL